MGPEELRCPSTPRRRLRPASFIDLGLLLVSSLLFALAFPSFLSDQGWFPLGFICLVPLFAVVRRASWPAVPFYGLFFGYASYALFNYWLGKFHPLTLVVVPPIYAAYFLVTLPGAEACRHAFPAPCVSPAVRAVGLLRVFPEEQRVSRLLLRQSRVLAVSLSSRSSRSRTPSASGAFRSWSSIRPSLLGRAFADGLCPRARGMAPVPRARGGIRRRVHRRRRVRPGLARGYARRTGSGRWPSSSRTSIPGRADTRPTAPPSTSWNGRACGRWRRNPRS